MESKQPDLGLMYGGLKVSAYVFPDSIPDAQDRGFFDPGTTRLSQHYLELSAYYRKAFEQYMLVTLRLDSIDQSIEGSGLGFAPWWDEKITLYAMSQYEKDTMLSLRHLYVKSPIHIERLNDGDLATLEGLYAENGPAVTQDALDFVARTYPELIRIYMGDIPIEEGAYANIDPGGACVNPDSLMIAFTDDDHNKGDEDSDNWKARYGYLKEYLPELQKELSEKLSVPVTLLIVERGVISYIVDSKTTWDPYAKYY